MSGEDDEGTEPSQPPSPRTLRANAKELKKLKLLAKVAGKSAVKEMAVVLEPRLQGMEAATEVVATSVKAIGAKVDDVITRVAKLEASPIGSAASGSNCGSSASGDFEVKRVLIQFKPFGTSAVAPTTS